MTGLQWLHSLEIRLPYLDHRLIEFMARVPAKWKIHGIQEKYILKKSLKDYLPASIVNRPKNPYRAPISQGLMHPESLERMLKPGHQLFDQDGIQNFINRISNSERISEVDNMGLVGILTTYYLNNMYICDKTNMRSCNITPDRVIDRRITKSMD